MRCCLHVPVRLHKLPRSQLIVDVQLMCVRSICVQISHDRVRVAKLATCCCVMAYALYWYFLKSVKIYQNLFSENLMCVPDPWRTTVVPASQTWTIDINLQHRTYTCMVYPRHHAIILVYRSYVDLTCFLVCIIVAGFRRANAADARHTWRLRTYVSRADKRGKAEWPSEPLV